MNREKFEEDYIKFENELLKPRPSLDFIQNYSECYKKLFKKLFEIYDQIKDKEKWLKAEIMCLINDKDNDFLIKFENEYFRNFYRKSTIKYDFIYYYLQKTQKQYDISEDLIKVYQYYSDKNEGYKVLHIIVNLTLYSKRNSYTDQLINNILEYYQNDSEFENYTLILELDCFIEDNYTSQEYEMLKNTYPCLVGR